MRANPSSILRPRTWMHSCAALAMLLLSACATLPPPPPDEDSTARAARLQKPPEEQTTAVEKVVSGSTRVGELKGGSGEPVRFSIGKGRCAVAVLTLDSGVDWSPSAQRYGVEVVGKTSGVSAEISTGYGSGSAEVEHGWMLPGEVMGRTAVVDFGCMHRPTDARLSVSVSLPWSCNETDKFNCDSLRTAATTGSFSVALYERAATDSDVAEAKSLSAGAREESMSTYEDKCAPCRAKAQACLAADQTPATCESQFSDCRFPLTDSECPIR